MPTHSPTRFHHLTHYVALVASFLGWSYLQLGDQFLGVAFILVAVGAIYYSDYFPLHTLYHHTLCLVKSVGQVMLLGSIFYVALSIISGSSNSLTIFLLGFMGSFSAGVSERLKSNLLFEHLLEKLKHFSANK